jgi:hypothetical protein
MAAAKNGDEMGFESLAKRHQRRIFALAFGNSLVRCDSALSFPPVSSFGSAK